MVVGSFLDLLEDHVSFEGTGFDNEAGNDQLLGNLPPIKVANFLDKAILDSIVNDKKVNEAHLLTYQVVVLT